MNLRGLFSLYQIACRQENDQKRYDCQRTHGAGLYNAPHGKGKATHSVQPILTITSTIASMLSLDKQNQWRDVYRAEHPEWRPATEVFARRVREHSKLESRLLDIGCGRGGIFADQRDRDPHRGKPRMRPIDRRKAHVHGENFGAPSTARSIDPQTHSAHGATGCTQR